VLYKSGDGIFGKRSIAIFYLVLFYRPGSLGSDTDSEGRVFCDSFDQRQASTAAAIYACYDTLKKCLHDLFVVGMTLRNIIRDGNRGAGGSGLPNGVGGSGLPLRWFCASRRLVSAAQKTGFRSASWVREGPT
jgi:hypothetical protein